MENTHNYIQNSEASKNAEYSILKQQETYSRIRIFTDDDSIFIPPVPIKDVIGWTFRDVPKSNHPYIQDKYTNPKTAEDTQNTIKSYLDYVLKEVSEEEIQTKDVIIIDLPQELKKHMDYFETHFVALRKNDYMYYVEINKNGELKVTYYMPAQKNQITYLGDYSDLYLDS